MKWTKFAKLLILINVTALISGCIIQNNEKPNQLLNLQCGDIALSALLLKGDTYPAIARENDVEGIVQYSIDTKNRIIKTSIISSDFQSNNKKLSKEKHLLLNEVFRKVLNEKLNTNCISNLTGYKGTIAIAYKLNGSNFEPKPIGYDILIQNAKVKLSEHSNY